MEFHDHQLMEEPQNSIPPKMERILAIRDDYPTQDEDENEEDVEVKERGENEKMVLSRSLRKKDEIILKRQRWANWVEVKQVDPVCYCLPQNLDDIRFIVREAESKGAKVRAFGSGHAIHDVAATSDYLIDTSKLQDAIHINREMLKEAFQNDQLVQVEAGIKVKRLNKFLRKKGLALINMGGSDVQSIMGAISTSTHGSGINLGPFPSMVKSLILVSSDGRTYRIEPSNGITDPEKYQHPFIELKQDDDWFYSAVVGMGCMGIVYAVTLEVTSAYLLTERRRLTTWTQIRAELIQGDIIRQHRHFELLINPYNTQNDHTVIITTRDVDPDGKKPMGRARYRNFLPSLLAGLPQAGDIATMLFNLSPGAIPERIDQALNQLEDDEFTNDSYKVLNQGARQLKFVGCAIETCFSMDKFIEGIEKVFELAEEFRWNGEHYLTSPIGIRFVKASPAYLSMMHDQDSCTIEVPVISGTIGWRNTLEKMELALADLGGRTHWGLGFHPVTDLDTLRERYPQIDKWLDVYQELNPKGTFNNDFTDRMGFSVS